MDARSHLLIVFASALGVLVIASIAGVLMARRHPQSEAVANFNSRTQAWWVMAAMLGLSLWLGKPAVTLLFGIASIIAFYEFMNVIEGPKHDRLTLWLVFLVVLPFQYYLIWIGWYGLFAIFIPVYGFLLLAIATMFRGETTGFIARVAGLQWGLMISVYCLSYVPALMLIPVRDFAGGNILLITFLIFVVEASDILQYIWGKLIGRHKVAPQLSPGKTIEGAVGGMLSATLFGAALYWITPFSPWQAALIALVITAMGFCGGLVMSAIKRDRGVKDWGWLIKGHGGVLDRIDAILFAAPIYFHIIRYFWSA